MHGFYIYTLDLDFTMLRQQKEFLIKIMHRDDCPKEASDNCAGLVNMIDSIQDYAVDNNYLTELEVFGEENVKTYADEDNPEW